MGLLEACDCGLSCRSTGFLSMRGGMRWDDDAMRRHQGCVRAVLLLLL